MKRIILSILLIFSLFIGGCDLKTTNIVEIEVVNTANNEKFKIEGDSETAKSIINALNKVKKTDVDVSSFFLYNLNVKKSGENEIYELYFDLDNKSIYVLEENNVYKVKDEEAEILFLDNNFSYIYINSTVHEAYLNYNGKKLRPEIKYNWTYKDINGHFVKKDGIFCKSNIEEGSIVVSDNDSINIQYATNPNSQTVKLYSQGKLETKGTSLDEIIKKIVKDGEYYVECDAQWFLKDGTQSYGSETMSFDIVVDRKADVSIITRENYPGNILLLYIENLNINETAKIVTDAVKIQTNMYSYKDKNIFMYPIDLNTAPGDYKLSLIVSDGNKTKYTVEKVLTVKNKSFKTQYLTVADELNETNNDNAAIFEFVQLVKPARSTSVDEKLWEGTFIMPVEGELTTDFAEIRYVNKEETSSRHSGLDLAAEKGTVVKAPNNGVVAFAMEGLLTSGNTLVIDHGMGLFTSYYHLDTIEVEKGDKVKKGDVIGTVGTTGFSTGPHLHYAVSIYNSYVNPYQTLSGIID